MGAGGEEVQVRVCVRVFSVGFGPGLDSMSPARSRRSTSHAAGTHGWLPKKKLGENPAKKCFKYIAHKQCIYEKMEMYTKMKETL